MTKSTLTLTQSGLLAVLLQHQRRNAIQLARRRAYRAYVRAAFWHMLSRSLRVVGMGTLAGDLAAKHSLEIFARQI